MLIFVKLNFGLASRLNIGHSVFVREIVKAVHVFLLAASVKFGKYLSV